MYTALQSFTWGDGAGGAVLDASLIRDANSIDQPVGFELEASGSAGRS